MHTIAAVSWFISDNLFYIKIYSEFSIFYDKISMVALEWLPWSFWVPIKSKHFFHFRYVSVAREITEGV